MLNAEDLLREQKDRKKKTKQIYKDILENCYKKIKLMNNKNQTSTVFRLQIIQIGYPLYDIIYAAKYIKHKLTKGGFKVTIINTNSLCIDWSNT